jgi:tRNA pseudouridine55 synthase
MARKRTEPQRSGFLVIDKPAGWTSHDVVGRVRRVVGERQVGHAGTLDPAATGALPVAVGHATRLLPFLEDTDKTYIATVRFGVETDSGDRDGRLLSTSPVDSVSEERIRSLLDRFRGETEQIPPMHSAIKVGGRRLYEHARAGDEVEVPARRVSIHSLDVLAWDHPDAVLRVTCSAGTYVRSLARDLGNAVGAGAMLSRLTRTASGQFGLNSAISIHDLEERLDRWGWAAIALHPDAALPAAEIVVLKDSEADRWFNGMPIERSVSTPVVRVYDSRREWIGVGMPGRVPGHVYPKRVVRGRSRCP